MKQSDFARRLTSTLLSLSIAWLLVGGLLARVGSQSDSLLVGTKVVFLLLAIGIVTMVILRSWRHVLILCALALICDVPQTIATSIHYPSTEKSLWLAARCIIAIVVGVTCFGGPSKGSTIKPPPNE